MLIVSRVLSFMRMMNYSSLLLIFLNLFRDIRVHDSPNLVHQVLIGQVTIKTRSLEEMAR